MNCLKSMGEMSPLQPLCIQSLNLYRLLGDDLTVRHGHVSGGFPIFRTALYPNEPWEKSWKVHKDTPRGSLPHTPTPAKKKTCVHARSSKRDEGTARCLWHENWYHKSFSLLLPAEILEKWCEDDHSLSLVQSLGRGPAFLHWLFSRPAVPIGAPVSLMQFALKRKWYLRKKLYSI